MSKGKENNKPNFERDLGRLVRLPQGVQQYIRELKESGQFGKAMIEAAKYRREKVLSTFKRSGTVDEELLMVIDDALHSENPEVTNGFKALWCLHVKGRATLNEIAMEMKDFSSRNPGFNPQKLAEIKDEVQSLRLEKHA